MRGIDALNCPFCLISIIWLCYFIFELIWAFLIDQTSGIMIFEAKLTPQWEKNHEPKHCFQLENFLKVYSNRFFRAYVYVLTMF